MSKLRLKLVVILFSALLVAASIVEAKHQTGQKEEPPKGAPAGNQQTPPAPKNLQVLPKDMTFQQVLQKMRSMSQELGVECNFCHVRPFEQDTPRKAVARLMLRDYEMGMKHKDGSALDCAACHKNQPNLLRTRPFEMAVGRKTEEIQVLKGIPRAKLMETMMEFTKALGVECIYCHTSDFDEDTPRKQIARFMMTEYEHGLVKSDGSAVTCNECHQGHARPLSVLPFPRREQRQPEKPPEPANKKPS